MATWRFDAVLRFGQYHGALYKANAPAPNLNAQPALNSATALADHLQTLLDEHHLEEDVDEIIWRNVSYESFDRLLKAVSAATY